MTFLNWFLECRLPTPQRNRCFRFHVLILWQIIPCFRVFCVTCSDQLSRCQEIFSLCFFDIFLPKGKKNDPSALPNRQIIDTIGPRIVGQKTFWRKPQILKPTVEPFFVVVANGMLLLKWYMNHQDFEEMSPILIIGYFIVHTLPCMFMTIILC